jgi:pimeloyl-ACP methyl ester carboxylesterase
VPGAYRISDFADDVQSLIESRGRPVALFGHSLGGNVALAVAARIPDRIRALIVGDAPLTQQTRVFAQQRGMLEQWASLAGKSKAVIVPRLKALPMSPADGTAPRPAREVLGEDAPWFGDMAESLAHNDPTFLAMILDDPERAHEGFAVETLLPAIPCPTLLLQADERRGGLMTDEHVELAKRCLPQPRHVKLSGIGHALFVDDHDAVLQIVRTFLKAELDP